MFLVALAAYLTGAVILVFGYGNLANDAVSRLANAHHVLFSRDPHLAAIGFVWNPLPSVAVMPFLPFKFLFPALSQRAFATNLVSAACMAGVVHQIWGTLGDWRVSEPDRRLLTLLFAANPLILEYGANGMSEALFLLTLVIAMRHLARWLHDGRVRPLAIAAVALGVGYLARYEALGAAVPATAVVAGAAFARSTGERRERVLAALAEVSIFVLPFAAAFVGWATASFIIVGHPFEQLTSVYGNASEVKVLANGSLVQGGLPRLAFSIRQLMGLTPLFSVGVALAAWTGWRRRDPRVLAPIAVLGGVLAFAFVVGVAGSTFRWIRFWIEVIPLTVLLCGVIMAKWREGGTLIPELRYAAIAVAAAAFLGTSVTISSPALAPEGKEVPRQVLHKGAQYPGARAFAHTIDHLGVHNGGIVMDTFSDCQVYIVLNSQRPRQFVLPSDRDFKRLVSEPALGKVQYLLAPARGGFGDLDAVNRTYPTLADDGAGVADLVRTFKHSGCTPLNLYRVRAEPRAGS